MMDTLRKMIILDPRYFLLMPKIRQALLVDKMVQSLVSLPSWARFHFIKTEIFKM